LLLFDCILNFYLKEDLIDLRNSEVDQVPETIMRLIVYKGAIESLLVDKMNAIW
jgi:hypothetical protein